MGLVDGRVVIVTGAGRGIGRAHALAFAAEGAVVVVNAVGARRAGPGGTAGTGGRAVANVYVVADWSGSQRLVNTTIVQFGRRDVLVNKAGFLRGRRLANLT